MQVQFHNRRAVQIENRFLRLTVTAEGGHIAEILDKGAGISPLWIPSWPSIEPTTYVREKNPEYGNGPESHLLSGIMGHSLCLDMFGPPSPEELVAGMTAHGEANVLAWQIFASDKSLVARCVLPVAQLAFERKIEIADRQLFFAERVESFSALDRPIAWTQHVTFGSPFLERGVTQFRASATKSRALRDEVDFEWPLTTRDPGVQEDLQLFTAAEHSGGYSAHLMNSYEEKAWFVAFSPRWKLGFGCVWRRSDFPWLGIWDENHSRMEPPWNGRELARGMEFGVSPFPETRRQMIERHTLFDTPCYRWLPARGALAVEYRAFIVETAAIPESCQEFERLVHL